MPENSSPNEISGSYPLHETGANALWAEIRILEAENKKLKELLLRIAAINWQLCQEASQLVNSPD